MLFAEWLRLSQAFRVPKTPDITRSDEMPLTSNSEPIDQGIRAIHTALLGSENTIELPTIKSQFFSCIELDMRIL